MFSLDDGMRYWLFTEPTDMRKSFHMLSGIVNKQMSFDLRSGDTCSSSYSSQTHASTSAVLQEENNE